MKGFKLSPVHLPPIKRIQVKRTHYRVILACGSVVILVVHHYVPEHEAYVGLAVNLMFAFDPTV